MVQKVLPSAPKTHEEALDACAADGASLPKLLTKDDTVALKHYMDNNNFIVVWTSLLKVNTTIACADQTCDGLVEWAGGPAFAFDVSIHKGVTVNSNDKASCFRFRGDLDKLDDVQCANSYAVICQFTPSHVPSDYELRNGKYYKVLDLIQCYVKVISTV